MQVGECCRHHHRLDTQDAAIAHHYPPEIRRVEIPARTQDSQGRGTFLVAPNEALQVYISLEQFRIWNKRHGAFKCRPSDLTLYFLIRNDSHKQQQSSSSSAATTTQHLQPPVPVSVSSVSISPAKQRHILDVVVAAVQQALGSVSLRRQQPHVQDRHPGLSSTAVPAHDVPDGHHRRWSCTAFRASVRSVIDTGKWQDFASQHARQRKL